MPDVKKEVKLEFTADTTGVKRAMQEFSSYQKEMSQNASKISTTGLKSHKDLNKIAKKNQKLEELTRGKKAVHAEKTIYRAVAKTTKDIVKRQKAYKGIVKHVGAIKHRMKAVTTETRKAGSELKKAMAFFGIGGGPGGPSGPGRGGGGRGRGGGFAGTKGFFSKLLKGAGSMIMGMLMGGLGGAFGLLTGQLSGGYAEHVQYSRQYGQLAGTGGRRNSLNRQKGFGAQMGFGGIEMAQQALPFARATGVVGGDALRQGMALQRATSLNAGEASGFMGMLTQAGTGFGGKAGKGGKAELVKTLALGVHSGLDRARMPEFFAATSQLVQRQMGVAAGGVQSSAAARLLAMLGASGQSGLQGARGGQVAGALDKAIRQPGGGEAGQAFMLQAMGFGKPGGGTSYYDALKKQERGVFGKGNLSAMFSESEAQYGGGQAQILALRTLTGLSIDQLEAVRDVVNSNMSNEEEQAALKKIEEESKSIEEQALDEMKEFGHQLKRLAGLQNRSIGIGEQVSESVEQIEEVVNELIDKFMPDIVKALKLIADVLVDVRNYIATWLDSEFTPEQKKELEARTTKAIEEGREEEAIAASKERLKKLKKLPENNVTRTMEVAGVGAAIVQAVRGEATFEEGVSGLPRSVRSRRIAAEYTQQARASASIEEQQRRRATIARTHTALSEQAIAALADGVTPGERRLIDAINALKERLSGSSVEQQDEALRQSRALLSAIDESRRNRAGDRPNPQRHGPTTPTGTGRGR